MDFSADASLFLADFGKPVTSSLYPGVSGYGILDMEGAVLADGSVLSTNYGLTALTSQFGALKYGDPITHNGVAFTVRQCSPFDDGVFSLLILSKV